MKFFKSHREEDYEDVDEENPNIKEDDRATILDKYMQHTDNNYMKEKGSEDNDTCPVCNSKTRTLLVNDGLMYCNDCHTIETIIIDHEKPKWLGTIVVIVLTASFLYM